MPHILCDFMGNTSPNGGKITSDHTFGKHTRRSTDKQWDYLSTPELTFHFPPRIRASLTSQQVYFVFKSIF